ncbi:homoserine kinase [Methylophilaceae bacterium]|nr:homoserine kinase [Methylophilaceae bacterium]
MAVYTSLSQSEVETFISKFNIGKLKSYAGISGGVTNSNFFINTDSCEAVLTIFEELNFEDLDYYFSFMQHLSTHGFLCPRPISDSNNNLIHDLKGKPAALISKLPGKVFEEINDHQLIELAKSFAEMHLISLKFNTQKKNERDLQWMKDTFSMFANKISSEQRELINEELSFLENLSENLPRGVIHADLFRDNVLFEENRLGGIIDFYYACNDFFIYDIAIVINDWCIDPNGIIIERRKKLFIEAYDSIRQLNNSEYEALNSYLRLAAMRFLISRFRDQFNEKDAELNTIKDPLFFYEILKNRRQSLN